MKIIELNIGLHSKTHGKQNPVEILNALTGRGFVLIKYRVAQSTSEDGEEPCLAVKAQAPSDWQDQIAKLAHKLGQDCIAVCGFIGHNPYDAFVPEYWITPETPEEGDKDTDAYNLANLARLAREAEDVDEWKRESFVEYLRETLIPDLRESGFDATADDFETACRFITSKE